MRQPRYSDEQIAAAVRKAESGVPVAQIVRELGISESTFKVWMNRFESRELPPAVELAQLRHENAVLKRVLANVSREDAVCATCADGPADPVAPNGAPSKHEMARN